MIPSRNIIGIMAATKEGIIGNCNSLPWDYSDERQHLIRMTKGHCVIMGRKTFESIPSSFYIDRTPLILSRNQSTKFLTARSINDCLAIIDRHCHNKQIFMIGGAKIAHLFLQANLISEFILTTIHKPYQGDTVLDMNFFQHWGKLVISSNERFTISKLTPKQTKL